MSVVGTTYLEAGEPVLVLAQWRGRGCRERSSEAIEADWLIRRFGSDDPSPWARSNPDAPRNVLIRRPDGTLVVRPFRGLRRTT